MSVPSTGNEIDVYRLPSFTLVATPEAHHGITYKPQKNAAGTGGFTIPLDDPAYADIQINDLAAIRRDGHTVATVLIERIEEHTLDTQGGAKQVASYMGSLAGGVLGWIVLEPALGDQAQPIEDDAVWDWRSPRYDPADDSWVAATEIKTVTAAKASGGWPHQPMGRKFTTSSGAMMIIDASGDDTTADPFWRIFYRDITITTPGRYGIEVLMDDLGLFWVDGIQQLDVPHTDGFVTASFKRLTLSEGTHRFCWAVFNFEDPGNPGEGLGPAALAYYLYKADLQDAPLDGGDSWISDDSTKVLYIGEDQDDFPGMTVGDDLAQWIAEGDVRDAGTWIVPTFDKDTDSNGDPWTRLNGVTTKTGTTTLLQFLDELVSANRISRWRMRPNAATLDVYRPGYSTRPGDVELEVVPVADPNTGQVHVLDRVIT